MISFELSESYFNYPFLIHEESSLNCTSRSSPSRKPYNTANVDRQIVIHWYCCTSWRQRPFCLILWLFFIVCHKDAISGQAQPRSACCTAPIITRYYFLFSKFTDLTQIIEQAPKNQNRFFNRNLFGWSHVEHPDSDAELKSEHSECEPSSCQPYLFLNGFIGCSP